ncbi:hypothetical protein BKA62DRAFT_708228 [Auriculariales sp. MPI-PUGE-AT-0066]|nr:hypothetical protein BKA62DRAFT_708228 [Auriculariales sp. MPI-PUGE-AT-0066]
MPYLFAAVNRDTSRPGDKVNLGPVDTSCTFIVVDRERQDMPIIYASETFYMMTGYPPKEVINKNCRFLQSPVGRMEQGGMRQREMATEVNTMREAVGSWNEIQTEVLNFRKGGESFRNLVTIIPIADPYARGSIDYDKPPRYIVGFQVNVSMVGNMSEQLAPDGTYLGPYQLHSGVAPSVSSTVEEYLVSEDLHAILGTAGDKEKIHEMINDIMLEHNTDFLIAVSLEGKFQSYSQSFGRLFGWSRQDCAEQGLHEMCHPADRTPLISSITKTGKLSSSHPKDAARLLFRLRVGPMYQSTFGGDEEDDPSMLDTNGHRYLWVECTAKRHNEASKSKQDIIISGRSVFLPPAPRGGLKGVQAWALLDSRGVVLVTGPAPIKPDEQDALREPPLLDVDPTRFGNADPNATQPLASLVGPSGPSTSAQLLPSRRSVRYGRALVPEVGRMFAEVAIPEYGREVLEAQMGSPQDGLDVVLTVTGERARISMSVAHGRVLAVVRSANEMPERAHNAGAMILPELYTLHEQSWRHELATLRVNNNRLRDELNERRKRQEQGSKTLGKRARET